MIVLCPSCGHDVEFRFDDSLVRVCEFCRSAVVRTDRGADTLGKFADLVPIESTLKLFSEGKYGETRFQLIGMAQLRHPQGGVWQEWYARLDSGQWAWISEAQGRVYLTFERADVASPGPLEDLHAGMQVQLAGMPFTVAEHGMAHYISARGEIPYRLIPGAQYRFADLADGSGGFATVDYGTGGEPPTVYMGTQATAQGLHLSGGEDPPPAAQAKQGAKLACPNCNGGLELRVPDQTQRIVCPYCNTLVDVSSPQLAIIARLKHKPSTIVPLGSKATFADGEMTVIGFLIRSAFIDDTWWPFEEYLLYAPGVGFRWLVSSDNHWSYVQPIGPGAVKAEHSQARYDHVTFQRFQSAQLRVDAVLGELYWQVKVGERVTGEDYIAPPAMLSCETQKDTQADEQNWSLSSYLTRKDVARAFGNKQLALPPPIGVAPNQPYPGGVGKVSALIVCAFFAVGITKCATAPATSRMHTSFNFPANAKIAPKIVDPTLGSVPAATGSASDVALDPWLTGSAAGSGSAGSAGAGSGTGIDVTVNAANAEPPGTVMFSDKFKLDGGHNLQFTLHADVTNNWTYAALDLINDQTASVVSFDTNIEYYAGVEDGESWSEGSRDDDQVLAPVEPGTYVLRVEAVHGGKPATDVRLDVELREGVFRWKWFGIFALLLGIPFALVGWNAYAFRKRRWENSNLGGRS